MDWLDRLSVLAIVVPYHIVELAKNRVGAFRKRVDDVLACLPSLVNGLLLGLFAVSREVDQRLGCLVGVDSVQLLGNRLLVRQHLRNADGIVLGLLPLLHI